MTDKLGKLFGYQNKVFGKNTNEFINQAAKYFTDDKLDSKDMFDLMDKLNWLSFYIAKFMNASLSADFVMTNPKVEKRKQELLKQYNTQIKNGDPVVTSKIENELLDIAKEENKESPAMQIYDSKCRGSYGNNYKCTSVMRKYSAIRIGNYASKLS